MRGSSVGTAIELLITPTDAFVHLNFWAQNSFDLHQSPVFFNEYNCCVILLTGNTRTTLPKSDVKLSQAVEERTWIREDI